VLKVRTVKIEIADNAWVEFRKLALERNTSVQKLLGVAAVELVIDAKMVKKI
jgi:hypothetical protein